jgi:hypothetical protein
MSGKKDAVLHHIQLIDIHGTCFYDIVFAHTDAPDQMRRARIGVDDAYSDPRPGDDISVTYLMNVVTGIARR